MEIELSIVIISYNGAHYLDRLLASMQETVRHDSNIEIITVDNASTDNTTEILLKWAKEYRNIFHIIKAPYNLGIARGRNLGIDNSSGKYILILDNDTIVSRDSIKALLSHMKNNPGCGIAAPALYSPDGLLQDSAKEFPGMGIKIKNLLSNTKELVNYGSTDILSPYYVIGACQIFSRSTFEKVGKLDTKIFYGPEDADFCDRVRKTGLSIDYIPSIHITHDWQRATRRSPFSKLSLHHIKALIYFYIKKKRLW